MIVASMDAQTFKRLKEVYYSKGSVSDYDLQHERLVYGQPKGMVDAVWAELCAGDHPPNDFRVVGHDQLLADILAADASVSWDAVFDGFMLGCSGRWPRGRQTLISAARARQLTEHAFEGPDDGDPDRICERCGLPRRSRWDQSDETFRLYWGYAWNETPSTWWVDLDERARAEMPTLEDADVEAFAALLRAIDEAPPDETPGRLEKRLGKAKLLPGADKYRRYGILIALGEVGVLPNTSVPASYDAALTPSERHAAHEALGQSHRSDVVLPLAGWRGELGVDWARAEWMFGVAN